MDYHVLLWYGTFFCTLCSISSSIYVKLATSGSWEILVYLGVSKISLKHLFCKIWILESASISSTSYISWSMRLRLIYPGVCILLLCDWQALGTTETWFVGFYIATICDVWFHFAHFKAGFQDLCIFRPSFFLFRLFLCLYNIICLLYRRWVSPNLILCSGWSPYVQQQQTVLFLLYGSDFHVLVFTFFCSRCIRPYRCKEYEKALHMFSGLCCLWLIADCLAVFVWVYRLF